MADYHDFCEEQPFLILDHEGIGEPVLVWFGVDEEEALPFFVRFAYKYLDNYLAYEKTERFAGKWKYVEGNVDEGSEFCIETFYFESEKDALNLMKTALSNSTIRFRL